MDLLGTDDPNYHCIHHLAGYPQALQPHALQSHNLETRWQSAYGIMGFHSDGVPRGNALRCLQAEDGKLLVCRIKIGWQLGDNIKVLHECVFLNLF